MASPKYLTLNDGCHIPMLAYGVGTAHVRSKMKESPDTLDRSCVDHIKTAIKLGYRHLDTAEMYGTEPELGVAIRESITEGVIHSREDLFITSKVSTDPMQAEKAIDDCLARMGLGFDYLDLYLIHSPYFGDSDVDLQTAWSAMERVKASGKARSIGVSNYEPRHIEATLAKATSPPTINQIEFHPYMTMREGQSVLEGIRAQSTAVSAYGILAPMTRKIAGPLDKVIEEISHNHGVSPGLLCLRWAIEQEVVAITTSQNAERMEEYLGVYSLRLNADEVKRITDAGSACLEGREELKPRIIHYYESLGRKVRSD